ncbi:MAG: hypothetical protein ACXV8R_13895 [Acidimicrobiia bacterium]
MSNALDIKKGNTMMEEPTFESVVGGGVCPECGWTTSLHSPQCMIETPAAEYVHGVIVENADDVPPAE